jgi:hypothetical protein
VTTNKYLNN